MRPHRPFPPDRPTPPRRPEPSGPRSGRRLALLAALAAAVTALVPSAQAAQAATPGGPAPAVVPAAAAAGSSSTDTAASGASSTNPAARGADTPAGGLATVAGTGGRHTVSYDAHSLFVDGRRVLLQSAEFHYFRLPSPDLWTDVLEKFKAAGFTTVSLYFDWAYHSPAAGVYDFSGVRDVDRLLRIADRLGLYVIARPGPYINAETTGGGFPAWLKEVPGRARSSAPGYTAAYTDWLHHVDAIIARHLLTRGGSVILYQAENEYQVNTDAAYMQAIQDTARADGIDVPITTNDCCDAAGWSSTWGSGPGAVQIPGVDSYPQSFDCANPDTTWGPWGAGITERVRDDAPVAALEYQAGSIDVQNVGYEGCRRLTGPAYMSYFYKSNAVLSGATVFSYYMGFGGTNWGWLSQPNDVYTSYDYGAPITEARQLTAKYDEFKRQGYFLAALAPQLTDTDPATAPTSDNPALATAARANPGTGTQVVLVRHTTAAATTDDTARLDWTTPDGRYRVPVRVVGRDALLLVADADLARQHLVLSTSQLMTAATVGDRDVVVLYGTDGVAGSTVLRYGSRPTVRVLSGAVASSYDAATGDLRLDYTHRGLARVLVTGGGRAPMLLLVGTAAAVAALWRVDTPHGPVLVLGTDLVRSARVEDGTLELRADTTAAGTAEVFGAVRRVELNGAPVPARPTASGTLVAALPGPRAVRLPELTGWRQRAESPEAAPGFDDSRWTVADHPTSTSPFTPLTRPVLFSDDYGYHYGSVWYRGHFTAAGTETTVKLNAITGRRGTYLVWLNGRYLGSAAGGTEADADAPVNPDPGPGSFPVPAGLLRAGQPATLSVLVENMGHNDDWIADDNRFKQPRGLVGARVDGSTAPISWRIQGTAGGEHLTDVTRGPLNTGGLFGERQGWYLPGYPDRGWRPAGTVGGTTVGTGVTWLRTTFRLDLPRGQDTSVALRFGAAPSPDYRVMVFVNGWNLGQYGAQLGPQTDFVLPTGVLRANGANTVALAVVATGGVTLSPVGLVSLGTARGGVPVRDVPSPGYPLRANG